MDPNYSMAGRRSSIAGAPFASTSALPPPSPSTSASASTSNPPSPYANLPIPAGLPDTLAVRRLRSAGKVRQLATTTEDDESDSHSPSSSEPTLSSPTRGAWPHKLQLNKPDVFETCPGGQSPSPYANLTWNVTGAGTASPYAAMSTGKVATSLASTASSTSSFKVASPVAPVGDRFVGAAERSVSAPLWAAVDPKRPNGGQLARPAPSADPKDKAARIISTVVPTNASEPKPEAPTFQSLFGNYSPFGAAPALSPSARQPHKPALPSPLANVAGVADHYSWITVEGSAASSVRRPSVASSIGGEFPFPQSPAPAGSFSPASLDGEAHWSPSIPARSPLAPPAARRPQPMPSPPLASVRLEVRRRSLSQSSIMPDLRSLAKQEQERCASPPQPPSMRVSPASSYRTRQVSSRSGSPTRAPPMLTPPESVSDRRDSDEVVAAVTNMAWGDVWGINSRAAAAEGESVESSVRMSDLRAHEQSEQTLPSIRRPSAPVGGEGGASTPMEGVKRVGGEDLMGTNGGGFGPATRERVADLITELIGRIPFSGDEEIIHIVEYGALKSRSASMIAPIISDLAVRHATIRQPEAAPASFQITHTDEVNSDFRAISASLESHFDSYLNTSWHASHEPSLDGQVYSSFASRPFGARVMPPRSVSVGFSVMNLHWLSTDRKFRMAPATLAHGELMAFLGARASEFRTGGLLTMAFISRSEENTLATIARGPSSPAASPAAPADGPPPASPTRRPSLVSTNSDPPLVVKSAASEAIRPMLRERSHSSPNNSSAGVSRKKDIFAVLSSILAAAIQRLVSTNLLKPNVARQLLTLPIQPRTPRQTNAVLRAMAHSWAVEKSEVVSLAHPAWQGLMHGTVSPASYADHTLQLIKIFWEQEMRAVLKDSLLSRAAGEWVLECLWTVCKEKCEDRGPQELELEVQLVGLRRKE